MTYNQLAYMHLASILPAFLIGTLLFILQKGTLIHKLCGRAYLVLILLTGVITLFMPAKVGPSIFGHFGFIHLFSFSVFYSVPAAIFAIRKGKIRLHRSIMVGLYVGGIFFAGSFAFMPGRMLHGFIFS
jgi:uncharacterized membrane protein